MATSNKKDLDLAISQIDRQFGVGTIVKLGDSSLMEGVESISTGSLTLDIALGIQGVPRGRVTEIFGAEASGKTTLAYHIIAEAQNSGGYAAYLDVEHALDPDYASRCGVNSAELFVSQPDSAEQCLEVCEYLVRSGALDVIVLDSVAALVPKAELEGEMGDAHIGLQARLMSQALRKLTAAIGVSKTSVIFINQVREKVGVVWGNPEVTPGGRALKFYSSVRIDLRRIESVKLGTEIIGSRVRARIVKNKVAPPFRVAEFEIIFKEGISKESDVIDLADLTKVIQKNGAYFSYGDQKLGQGRENAKKFLKENPEIADEIRKKIHSSLAESTDNSI